MHIILVSGRLATARTLRLSLRHVAGAAGALALLVVGLSCLLAAAALRHPGDIPLPFVRDALASVLREQADRTEALARADLNAMAVKLGEMQARIMRLDAVGERLALQAGLKPQEVPSDGAGRGGPLVLFPDDLAAQDLQRHLDVLAQQVDTSADTFDIVEARLRDERTRLNLLPTALPVAGAALDWSGFGWRRDPITGQRALHEGVDFQADPGTPILAAAGGVVVGAEYHPAYGNMIEIDHGNELVTRYAHASKLLVRPGAVVRRGQKIAEVGSTGRSTGPHLHFEVRTRGAAQDPARFLRMARAGAAAVASAR